MTIIEALFNYLFTWLNITNFLLPFAPQLYENLFYWINRIFL